MILTIAVSLLAVIAFGLTIWWGRIVPVSRAAVGTTLAGLSAMMDSSLDDDAKEVAVRKAGFGLIIAAFNLLWRFALSLAAAAAPIYLAEAAGLVSSNAVFELMLRLDYILIVSVIAIVLTEIIRRRRSGSKASGGTSEHNHYSSTDRFFHVLAFSSPAVLRFASRAEDRLVSEAASAPSGPPIFVTSLARGGTTALLNALHDLPGIATHTYRDMPFLTAPAIWNRLAGGQKRNVERKQRAHGDGLEIDLDSPEAFEEVVWKMFWGDKFRGDTISLWSSKDHDLRAEEFFRQHMSKIIRTRLKQRSQKPVVGARYCSKNNANIARLSFLPEAFPGCRIVVPLRRPESHAASFLRQHQNFLKLQAEDDFIRRYMRDIGHFEFGLIHKPMAFPGFDRHRYDPSTPDYWLDYWIHAFREVLAHSDNCLLVTQDALRAEPQATMDSLCNTLGLSTGGQSFGSYFHSKADVTPGDLYSPDLLDEALAVYAELEAKAIRPTN